MLSFAGWVVYQLLQRGTMPVKGSLFVVTGASQGIGEQLARILTARGGNVVLVMSTHLLSNINSSFPLFPAQMATSSPPHRKKAHTRSQVELRIRMQISLRSRGQLDATHIMESSARMHACATADMACVHVPHS